MGCGLETGVKVGGGARMVTALPSQGRRDHEGPLWIITSREAVAVLW